MIVCPTCDRRNENHYKFCLGCGTELVAADRASEPPAPVAAPVAAPTALPTPSPIRVKAVTPAPEPVAEPVAAPEPAPELVATAAAKVVRLGPEAEPAEAPPVVEPPAVVDPLSDAVAAAATPALVAAPPREAAPRAVVLGPPSFDDDVGSTRDELAPVGLDEDDGTPDGSLLGMPPPPNVEQASADPRACRSCGAHVPEGFKFCGVCGSRFEGAALPVAATPMAPAAEHRARLVLIHPDGTEGEAFPLDVGETTVGRNHPLPLFRNDAFLSPRHATFFFVRGQLFVRDEASLNGVFLRIKAEVELFHRDMFRIGQQLLRFEEMSQVRPMVPGAGDGTTVLGSPVRGAWGRLQLSVGIDTVSSVWVLRRPEEQLGRERGEILFGDDGFISGGHCKLLTRDGRFFLRDIGSTNGTYLRIKGEGILAQGDLLLLGQQLFKVDLLA